MVAFKLWAMTVAVVGVVCAIVAAAMVHLSKAIDKSEPS